MLVNSGLLTYFLFHVQMAGVKVFLMDEEGEFEVEENGICNVQIIGRWFSCHQQTVFNM